MLEIYSVNKLKLAMILMKLRIIKTFLIGDGRVQFVWPWMFP